MYLHNFPQTHFLLMAEIVRSGKPFIAEKLMSETARLTSSMFGGVRRHLDLSKKNTFVFPEFLGFSPGNTDASMTNGTFTLHGNSTGNGTGTMRDNVSGPISGSGAV